LIEVEALTRSYGSLTAVDGLSFSVQPGEILGLVGANGAGKTTTLRCLAGILIPGRGEIRICGHSLRSNPPAAKRCLAFMPDEPRLFDYLTVEEHLWFVARIYQVDAGGAEIRALLEEMELDGKRGALPPELSRGMKQKLMIACGLLHSPRALLFDEPLTGLDPIGIRRMKTTIRDRAAAGASVVVSSHLLHLVEELCDRVLIIKAGRKVVHGTLEEISGTRPQLQKDASLEEIFMRIAGHAEGR